MIESKIELIYEIIINDLPLTKETLMQYGFQETEIIKLLEEKILITTNKDEYRLFSLYELYYYGFKLLIKEPGSKGHRCFKKCYQLDPNNRDFALQQFLSQLKLGHSVPILTCFSSLEKIESDKYIEDNNLYLYLLSMLTACPKEYQDRLNQIDYDSVLLKEDSTEYRKKEINDIRHCIMKFKYERALELLNNLIKKEPIRITQYEVLKELLTQVLNSERKFQTILLSFANNKNYKTIITFINKKREKRYLSNNETYIYLLAQALDSLTTTNSIPKITVTRTKNLYEAIKGNNYYLARKINNKRMRYEPKNLENQIIELLLNEINRLIYQIKQTENTLVQEHNNQEQIEELANYLQEENISIEKAIESMNVTIEQSLLIKLIYARNYYIEEMYLLGDLLVQEVEKSKEKTSEVIKLLNEVRINKKFYKNRREFYTKKRTK